MFKFKKAPFRYRILKWMGDHAEILFSFGRLLEEFPHVTRDDMQQHWDLLKRDELIVTVQETIRNPHEEEIPYSGKFIEISKCQISDKGLNT